MTLNIDQEYKALIPPLSAEEFAQLESNILRDGCRDSIVTWEETIIDGHNRYEICKKHGIVFKIITMEFDSKAHARIWIRSNQDGRRNLPVAWKIEHALGNKSDLLEIGKVKMSAGGGDKKSKSVKSGLSEVDKPDSSPKINTRTEIAEAAGVSTGQIGMAEIVKKKSPELWEKAKKGEISINKAYKETKGQDEPPCLVVNGLKEKSLASIKILQKNGISIYSSAKMVMDRLDDNDEEFTQSLDSMIAYCQKRITNRK